MNSRIKTKIIYEKIYISFIAVFSMAIIIYAIYFCFNDDYIYLWVLPSVYLVFTVLFYILFQRVRYNYGIVFIFANFIFFIRYVITPFSMIFTSSYNGVGLGPNPSYININYSIILMSLELAFAYITILFACSHYKKRSKCFDKGKYKVSKNNGILILFMLITIPITLVVAPYLIIPRGFGSIGEGGADISNVPFSGLFLIIAQCIIIAYLILSLSWLKVKYNTNKRYIYIFFSWISIFIFLGLNISASRWTLLFCIILSIILLMKLFTDTPKWFYITLIILAFFGLLSISIYKFGWAIQNSTNPYRDIIKVLMGQFQEYFAGPRSVAQAIEMKNTFKSSIGLGTFINDFLGSIPIISRFIDQSNRINVYYNLHNNISNNSLIIPMIGCGYIYIPFFPMIFTIISEWFMIYFDFKGERQEEIEFVFIYKYIGLYWAMCMGFNTQILFGKIISFLIPCWILFKVNRKVIIRKNKIK